MTITKSALPENSILKAEENQFHYVDSFQGYFFDSTGNIGPTEVGKAFFSSGPKWIESLFAVRNKLASLVGLKTSGSVSDRQKALDSFTCEKGERLGLFKVFDKTTNEIVLGEDDKHLNFRVSLFIDQQDDNKANKRLTISTTVRFHNWFGQLYFIPVRPFHKLIVPAMLKGIIKSIEKRTT